jgi:uncharacterized repeat protein (TIGR01451 family)
MGNAMFRESKDLSSKQALSRAVRPALRLLALSAAALAADTGASDLHTMGGQGHLTIMPTAIDFGDVAVGTVSEPQTVVLGNDGSADLDVTPEEPGGPFWLNGGTCPAMPSFTIAPGESCTLDYVFAPDSGGPIEIPLDVSADGILAGVITLAGNAYYEADVAVTISDNREFAQVGDTIVYTITVYMADGSDGAPVTVTDALPADLGNGTWTCVEANSTVCNSDASSGSGNTLINHVQLADGYSITYTYSATLLTDDQEEITNTVAVAVDPPFTVDPVPDNNSATDITAIPLFHNGFDGS